jgi:hypothetical protein
MVEQGSFAFKHANQLIVLGEEEFDAVEFLDLFVELNLEWQARFAGEQAN